MAAFRGVSISFAVVSVVIGIVALFSSPGITEDWWTDQLSMQWCEDCINAGNGWSCQWICGGDHQGDWYCDDYAFFQYQPQCWYDCGVPCHNK